MSRVVVVGGGIIGSAYALLAAKDGHHVTVLERDAARERDGNLDDPSAFARRWADITAATVEPLYRATLSFDRHRLAEIDAHIAGQPYWCRPTRSLPDAIQDALAAFTGRAAELPPGPSRPEFLQLLASGI